MNLCEMKFEKTEASPSIYVINFNVDKFLRFHNKLVVGVCDHNG